MKVGIMCLSSPCCFCVDMRQVKTESREMSAMEERWPNRKDKISMIPVGRGMNGVTEESTQLTLSLLDSNKNSILCLNNQILGCFEAHVCLCGAHLPSFSALTLIFPHIAAVKVD